MSHTPTATVLILSLLTLTCAATGADLESAPVSAPQSGASQALAPDGPAGTTDTQTMIVLQDDGSGSTTGIDDRPIFRIPTRAAYQNTFDRSTPLERIAFVPGESNIVADITTRLGADMPVVMMAFNVVNRNARHVLFDATMSIYPDAGGAPDLARPIATVPGVNLWAPGNTALGVVRLYLGQNLPVTLPPGRVWFGVQISNIRGGDPRLFGQIVASNVTAGAFNGTLLDANATPAPARITGISNVDRLVIPATGCRTDWDLNDRVDSNDLILFIWDYIYRTPDGDYNADGRTNANDYIAFFTDYMQCMD